MSAPFFNTAGRCADFVREALRWHHTPFVPHAAVCGAGVDCVNLGREIYKACGVPLMKSLPAYTMDGGKHNAESQLITWLEESGYFVRVSSATGVIFPVRPEWTQIGDTLCFKIGKSAHHAGFTICGTQFIHCLFGREVMLGDLRDKTFARWLVAIYRPLEVAA